MEEKTLSGFLKENGVTTYKLCDMMGISVGIRNNQHNRIARKIKGVDTMSMEMLENICSTLTSHLSKKVDPSSFEFEPVRFKLKHKDSAK